MPFSREAIQALAHLARLGIETTGNKDPIQEDLDLIIAMVDQISGANTEGIEPMAHPLETFQPLREDIVTESSEQRDQLLALAPPPRH